MKEDWSNFSKELAEAHVDWYLNSIRPLLIEHMIHGFKHGIKYVSPGSINYGTIEPKKE
jgi:hypothetical protein